jgi:hypothetical protein
LFRSYLGDACSIVITTTIGYRVACRSCPLLYHDYEQPAMSSIWHTLMDRNNVTSSISTTSTDIASNQAVAECHNWLSSSVAEGCWSNLRSVLWAFVIIAVIMCFILWRRCAPFIMNICCQWYLHYDTPHATVELVPDTLHDDINRAIAISMASHQRLGGHLDNNTEHADHHVCAAHTHFFHDPLYDEALLALIMEFVDGRQWQHARLSSPQYIGGRQWLCYAPSPTLTIDPPVRFIPLHH